MAIEFRGVKGLVVAEVLTDNESAYTTSAVKPLAPVAEISKTVETATDTHYYDNYGAIIINTEGSDTVTFTIAVPNDETVAWILGKTYDETRKRYIDTPIVDRYFAVGYIIGEIGEGEDERYVWRFKGKFQPFEETSATADDGTDANNISLVFTGEYTAHSFANGKGTGIAAPAKAQYIRKSSEVASVSQYFATVATPDTVFPAYTLSITQAAGTTVSVTRGGSVLANNAAIFTGDVLTISVTGGTITVNGAAFVSGNTHTVSANVTVVSTAGQ